MTESKICKSCQNIENCPCWSAKQTGRVISCHFYQEQPKKKEPLQVHDETQYADVNEFLSEVLDQLQKVGYERDASLVEAGQLRQRVQVLGAELMDAIQAHEDDTTTLRKQVDNQRKSLIRADKQAVKLIRQRKEWKEACAQLALEHNQLIEENEALKEGRVSFCDYQRSLSHARTVQTLRSELYAASQAAKLNKEAEVVALELLGEQKEKNKELKFKLQTSRAITCVVFLLAVTFHYFF